MRPIYIFDLDGTIADNSQRLHYVSGETKDWNKYYAECGDDRPIWTVIKVLQALQKDNDIWIWSGRADSVKDTTVAWLWRYGILKAYDPEHWNNGLALRFRREGDHRKNAELKLAWYHEVFNYSGQYPESNRVSRSNLFGVFEDHPEAATMWRSLGITCFELESR